MTWAQELRLMFTRRAMGFPTEPWEVLTWMVLDGQRTPSRHVSEFIFSEYEAWRRDQDETDRAARHVPPGNDPGGTS